MTRDVFVSYSTKDIQYADGVCAGLEAEQIKCWIAPRDILPGKDWGEAIIDAIAECRVMVVVFSVSANESPQVRREVQRAFEKGVTVVPVRIDDVLPAKSMAYYLSAVHWLDAIPPLEQHIHKLAEIVRQLLGTPAGNATPSSGPAVAELRGATPAPLEYSSVRAPSQGGKKLALVTALVAMLTLVGLLGAFKFRRAKPALAPVAGPGSAPSQVAALPSSAPSSLRSDQAVREIFQDLRKMDTQIGLIDRSFAAEMSDSAEAAIRALTREEGEFVSYLNVRITYGRDERPDVVLDRVAALQALGASPEAVLAFADRLLQVRRIEYQLPTAYFDMRLFTDLADTAIKLKLCPPEAHDEVRRLNDAQVRAALESLHANAFAAQVAALRLLASLQTGLPEDANAQLGALKNVQPNTMVSSVDLKALEDRAAADRKRVEERNISLKKEVEQTQARQADEWSAALRAPFKLSDFPIEQLLPMCGIYAPSPKWSENHIIIYIQQAGGSGHLENKLPCLFAYASIFAAIDPVAEDYARAGCQLTLQSPRLGCSRGLYLCKLLDGPAKEGGLRDGDIVIEYGAAAVGNLFELGELLKVMPDSEPVRVELLRRDELGRFHRQTATLPHGGSLGATFVPI